MRAKLFKILEQKKDCVLVVRYNPDMRHLYKVRDIENDDVYISHDYHKAKEFFEKFSIAEVRKEKKQLFEDWLAEFAEAKSEE